MCRRNGNFIREKKAAEKDEHGDGEEETTATATTMATKTKKGKRITTSAFGNTECETIIILLCF